MHTVEEIRREYKRLDQMIGVDTSHLEIIFSPRAVYQYGCCKYQRKNRKMTPYKILIASFLLEEERYDSFAMAHSFGCGRQYGL
mgnify:CR=1 FL=1